MVHGEEGGGGDGVFPDKERRDRGGSAGTWRKIFLGWEKNCQGEKNCDKFTLEKIFSLKLEQILWKKCFWWCRKKKWNKFSMIFFK